MEGESLPPVFSEAALLGNPNRETQVWVGGAQEGGDFIKSPENMRPVLRGWYSSGRVLTIPEGGKVRTAQEHWKLLEQD